MSYTELLGINSEGRAVSLRRFPNAWHGAMHIWVQMAKAYLPNNGDDVYVRYLIGVEKMRKVWNLWERPDIPRAYRITMATTFDYVIVPRDFIPEVITGVRAFAAAFGGGSLPGQADTLQHLLVNRPDIQGVCWHQTSVSADQWVEWSEDEGADPIPYNINTGTKHWFLNNDAFAAEAVHETV